MSKRKKKVLPLIAKLEIVGALLFIAVAVFSFTSFNITDITGHASLNVYEQNLDIKVSESRVYDLRFSSIDPVFITSIKLSGEVIGDGRAEISIIDSSGEILVYKNVKDDREGISAITGLSVKQGLGVGEAISITDGNWLVLRQAGKYSGGWSEKLYEKERLVNGAFENACIESCFISMKVSKDTNYKLAFKVDDGTELNIKSIVYTVREE